MNTPMCISPIRAKTKILIQFTLKKSRVTKYFLCSYIDLLWNHLNGTKLELKHQEHRCFSIQSIKISVNTHKHLINLNFNSK